MKQKWIRLVVSLLVTSGAILLWPSATGGRGRVSVSLLSVTNDVSGGKLATFCVTNGTKRLFVRGCSHFEVRRGASNQVTSVQIRNADYLQPGQAVAISLRSPAPGYAWRLNFSYIGQLNRLEKLREAIAWFLYHRGFPVSERRLRLAPACDITTEWING